MPWDGSTKGHTDAARCIKVICTRHNTAYKLSPRIQILGTNWLSLDSPDRLPVVLCRTGRAEVAVTWLELASSEVAYQSSTWLVRDNWLFFSCVGLVVVLSILLWTGPPSLIMPCAYFWWQSAGARNNPSAWNQVLSVSIQRCLGKTASAIWLEGGTRVNPLLYGWFSNMSSLSAWMHECGLLRSPILSPVHRVERVDTGFRVNGDNSWCPSKGSAGLQHATYVTHPPPGKSVKAQRMLWLLCRTLGTGPACIFSIREFHTVRSLG